jgi:hypothetical protein
MTRGTRRPAAPSGISSERRPEHARSYTYRAAGLDQSCLIIIDQMT